MVRLLILLSLLLSLPGGLHRVATLNQAKENAAAAFARGDYATAARAFSHLIDSLGADSPPALLNLAHAHYLGDRADEAAAAYRNASALTPATLRSVAEQQRGVMAYEGQNVGAALYHFKEALRADPNNQDARYNYELLRQRHPDEEPQSEQQQSEQEQSEEQQEEKQEQQQGQQEQQQQQSDAEQDEQAQQDQSSEEGQQQPKPNNEQQGEEQQSRYGEEEQPEGEEKPDDQQQAEQPREGEEGEASDDPEDRTRPNAEKLIELHMSEEKARAILEAMRNAEVQYLQQKKHYSSESRDPKKPDW